MSNTTSTRPLNPIVISVLSHTVGVSFKQVLANSIHVMDKFSVQIKVVLQNKTGFNKLVSFTRVLTKIRGHLVYCIVGTSCSMPRSGKTSRITTSTATPRNRRYLPMQLLEQRRATMLMKRMVQVILHLERACQMVRRRRRNGEEKIPSLMEKLFTWRQ